MEDFKTFYEESQKRRKKRDITKAIKDLTEEIVSAQLEESRKLRDLRKGRIS